MALFSPSAARGGRRGTRWEPRSQGPPSDRDPRRAGAVPRRPAERSERTTVSVEFRALRNFLTWLADTEGAPSVRTMGTITAISDRFVDAFAALDPVDAVCEMGVGLDADTMTDYSPDGEAAMADLYRSTRGELAAATPEDECERLGAGYLEYFCAAGLALIETGERSCLLSEFGPQAVVR